MRLALVSFYLRALISANIRQQNITVYLSLQTQLHCSRLHILRGPIDYDLMKARAGDSVLGRYRTQISFRIFYRFHQRTCFSCVQMTESEFSFAVQPWSSFHIRSQRTERDGVVQVRCWTWARIGQLLQVRFLHLKYMHCETFYWLSSTTKGSFARRPNVLRIKYTVSCNMILLRFIRASISHRVFYKAADIYSLCRANRTDTRFKVHKRMVTVSTIAIPRLICFSFF